MESLGIAMIGCGTVGGGVAKLLSEQKDRLAARSGKDLVLRRVVVRDAGKQRPYVSRDILSSDLQAALHDPAVSVVLELIGGVRAAKECVLAALAAGKHVVTAN